MLTRLFAFVLLGFVALPSMAENSAIMRLAQAAPDEMAWGLVRDSADPSVLARFLDQFPDSSHAAEAREKVKALEDQGGEMQAPATDVEAAPAQSTNYAMDVQRELKRVGCYGGRLDGDWGSGSRRALANFASAAGVRVGSDPTSDTLAIVRSKSGTVCVKAPKSTETATEAPLPGGAGCYTVSVTVDTLHPSGVDWDPWPGKLAIPDPIITELTTGTSRKCGQVYSCSMQVNGGGTFSFNIVDDDPDRADPIGSGSCKAGSSCRLGSARVSSSRC